jgi:hypothetical protein
MAVVLMVLLLTRAASLSQFRDWCAFQLSLNPAHFVLLQVLSESVTHVIATCRGSVVMQACWAEKGIRCYVQQPLTTPGALLSAFGNRKSLDKSMEEYKMYNIRTSET